MRAKVAGTRKKKRGSKSTTSHVRLVEESDAGVIAELFRMNYGKRYAFPEVFDGGWPKKCVYNDNIICLVLEEKGTVVGSGALVLDVGNHDDQVGELGRFVVHPKLMGKGRGQQIIDGLFRAAENNVEFAIGEARTVHWHSQRMVEQAGFQVIGFLPHYLSLSGVAENCIHYGKLYGNGRSLRSPRLPILLPEVAPLAAHVLEGMGLSSVIEAVQEAVPYPVSDSFELQEVDRLSFAQLARIKEGRLVEPLLFGKLSLDEGYSLVRRRGAAYLMAVDNEEPIGAIGFQFDETNKILIGIELLAATESLRGQLCASLLRVADQLGARNVEVNISAYDPRLQATFMGLGFKPLAYAPAMVFHGTERLDVIKMLKLCEPFDAGQMRLTESANAVFLMVEHSLREFTAGRRAVNRAGKVPAKHKASLVDDQFRFSCPNVRYTRESDAPEIVELFEMIYGRDYVSSDVYSGQSTRRCVYNRDMIGLVYVENDKVAASVTLKFDYGRISDQVGKISGFVVFPKFNRDWVAHSLLKSVFEAAEQNLEFVEGDLKVDSRFLQDQVEVAGLSPLAYLPRYWEVGHLNRGVLVYGKLLGNGYAMRSQMIPHVIPEVAELARFVLGDTNLPPELNVDSSSFAYISDGLHELRDLDRLALAQLAQIEEGRVTEPLILGSLSLEEGYSTLQRKGAVYLVAVDKKGRPTGAIGFQHDQTINVVKATEMIGKQAGLRGYLSHAFVRAATKIGARIIEVDVSAYDPRLQRTFCELGFRPVGYFPARVFRGIERLDVVRMIKLNVPYKSGETVLLTEKAERIVTLVEEGFC